MFCAKCGASIPDASPACPQCGASTADTPRSSAPPPSQAAPAPAWQSVPQPQRYSGPQETDGKAVASLVLGITSILFCLSFITGIPAVILGHISKSNISKSMGRLKGDGMATAGLIMGYISFTVMIPIILIIAAIAIPNLLRARIAANEAAAASSVRTLNTAQVTYSMTYPNAGYARSLSVLGPGEPAVNCTDPTRITPQHACLIDNILACPTGTWCAKGGYNYNVAGICGTDKICTDYVITATPVTPGTTGQKSFCSVSDAVIRFRTGGGPITTPLTVEECLSWPPVS